MISNAGFYLIKNHLHGNPEILHKVLEDDGIFPNNKLPVILYKDVIDFSDGGEASVVEKVFHTNGWSISKGTILGHELR